MVFELKINDDACASAICGTLTAEPEPLHPMIGQKFGRLLVLRSLGFHEVGIKRKFQRRMFECQCDCGNKTNATQLALSTSNKESCGCLRRDIRKAMSKDWTGVSYEFLTVIGRAELSDKRYTKWQCRCVCGKMVLLPARPNGLTAKSCGCKRSELMSKYKTQHGMSKRGSVVPQAYNLHMSMTSRARRLGLPYDFAGKPVEFVAWYAKRVAELGNKCPILGTEFVRGDGIWCDASPTIDRIKVTEGYVVGNIDVISHRANQIKNDATLDEIMAVARYLQERPDQPLP